jgi:hypothetical protein
MKTRPLTFLFALTFLFLFSGSSVVFADDLQDGMEAAKRQDYKTAHRLWLPLADQGNVLAQYNLGVMYAKGLGAPKDYKEAVKWYRLAAEQGNAKAQNDLGVMYHKELGALKNYKKAVKWYRLAAEQRNVEAQYNLGVMYVNGQGASQDYVLAYMWWNIAGSNGHKGAPKNRNIVEKQMTPQQIEQAQEMARNWKPTLLAFDAFGRLISTNLSVEIKCPTQTQRTGLLFAFGQSNSANSAEYKFKETELNGVVNYFNGKCYVAKSPLLGATGSGGEWISLTARKLIENGTYDNVVVVSSGIGGTRIERWGSGNDLNEMVLNVLADVTKKYKVTDIIWHQGESDRKFTHTKVYEHYFRTLVDDIRGLQINAPIFISIASVCGASEGWNYPNKITEAQTLLAKENGVELGINTDELIPISLRLDDMCHFGKQAQEKAAIEQSRLIAEYHLMQSRN